MSKSMKLSDLQNRNNVKMEDVVKKDGKNSGGKAVSLVQSLVSKLKESKLSGLAASADLMAFANEVRETLCPELALWGQRIGKFFARNENEVNLAHELITEDEANAVNTIAAIRSQSNQCGKEAALAYIKAFVGAIPDKNPLALAHATRQGLAVGLFREAGRDEQGTWVPVLRENGAGWDSSQLRATCSEARGLLEKLDAIKSALHKEQVNAADTRLTKMREGTTGNLLDVLEKGGIAAFPVPRDVIRVKDGEQKTLKGLRGLRVEVKDGKLCPLDAAGDAAWLVEKAIDQKVILPVESITEAQLKLGEYVEPELFKTLRAFHSLCHRGWLQTKKVANEKAKVAEFRQRATVSTADFCIRQAAGVAYLYLYEWSMGKGKDHETFKHLHFLVERNGDGELKVVDMLGKAAKQVLGNKYDEFTSPQELAYPLGAMLAVSKGRLETKEKRDAEAKTGFEGTGSPTPADAETEFTADPTVKAMVEAKLREERAAAKATKPTKPDTDEVEDEDGDETTPTDETSTEAPATA